MAKKTTKNQYKLAADSPAAYFATGLAMGVIGYVLFILATDSGSLIQYLGFIIAFVWGFARIVQAIKLYLRKKKK